PLVAFPRMGEGGRGRDNNRSPAEGFPQPDARLLVSGHAEQIAAPDVQLNQRIGFLGKPFRKSELANKLADMLPNEIVEKAPE
ncbi:MAG: hypothetical protein R6V30_01595, partial [Paracoccaceae bacterium]